MNAHVTKNNNISAGTVARTAEQWVTAGLTSAAAIWAWWENNSFTKEALAADSYLEQLKKGVH